jgi:hypothetical protein
VTVSVSASATTVESGGAVSLTASGVDNQSHTGFAWSWSDNGAGGTFMPSATVSNPTWLAPGNSSGEPVTRRLTGTVICKWFWPWTPASEDVTIVENSSGSHGLSLAASVGSSTVASGGTTALTAAAIDSLGHGIASWAWSDGGAGGSFSPSSTVQDPSYTAAPNTTGSSRQVTLTATATCDGSPTVIDSESAVLTVQSEGHGVTVSVSASATTVESGGAVSLTASGVDNQSHTGFAWSWSDNGAGGTFMPSATVSNPTWLAPGNSSGEPVTRRLTGTVICKWFWPWTSASADVNITESSN